MMRSSQFRFVALIVAGMLAGWGTAGAAAQSAAEYPQVTDGAVAEAIERGVRWLKQKRKADGHWEESSNTADRFWAGDSALALLALLYAKEDPRSDDMQKSLEWLAKQPITATYVYGARAHVLALVPGSKYRARLEGDISWLTQNCFPRNSLFPGSYGYTADDVKPDGGWADNSNAQFGVLGAWMGAEAGVKISEEYWRLIEFHWLEFQGHDGGWSYQGRENSIGSMTAAGLATLYVLLDQLHARDEGHFNGKSTANCGRYREAGRLITAIEAGLNWFGREFNTENPRAGGTYQYYYLYGVERAGRASGRKYFRNRDWFRAGAAELLKHQDEDGRWGHGGMGDLRNTCFAIMFLCHGRAPLLMNKLDYGPDSQVKLRDAAGLTRYAQHTFERLLNWQTVSLQGSFEDLLEAPLLYISGHEAPKLSDVEVQKLREYCLHGGTILGVACCGREDFSDGFRKLAARMFPEFPPRPVSAAHPLFNGEVQFKIDTPPQMFEVHNGTRSLMLLSTQDICTAWNQYLVDKYEPHFQLGCNIYLYATDKTSFTSRMQTADIPRRELEPKRTLRVARLKHSGHWDVEPFGWTRLTNYLNNETQTRLLVTSGVGLDSPELADFKVAYITGVSGFTLSPAEAAGLRKFLTDGGTLLADAAGGSAEFLAAFESQVGAVLKGQPRRLEESAPLITGEGIPLALPLKDVDYRRAARPEVGDQKYPTLKVFELGRRAAVIYSPLDLSCGLLGTPVYNCRGFESDSALRIVRNMLLYAGLSSDEKVRAGNGVGTNGRK